MNDDQLDRLVRGARPLATVDALDLHRGEQELLEEIMSTPVSAPGSTPRSPGADPARPAPDPEPLELSAAQPVSHRRRRRVLVGVAAAAAFAAAVAGPTIAFRGADRAHVSPGTSTPAPRTPAPGTPAPATPTAGKLTAGTPAAETPAAETPAPSPTLAGSNPGLLLDDPAWKITHVDEDSAVNGEMSFTKGRKVLDVTWKPASDYQTFYQDRLDVSRPRSADVLGREGALFTYGPADYAVMLPPQGRSFVEIRGAVGDRATFLALLARLRPASAAEWFAALPDSVVTPASAAAVADEMMIGVPWPDDVARTPFPTGRTMDKYQFGAAVVGRVSCAWLAKYTEARRVLDAAGMAETFAALSTNDRWNVFDLMGGNGDYRAVLEEFVNRVAQGEPAGDYRSAFDCP